MKIKILVAIIIILLIIAVMILAITHEDAKVSGDRGYANEWNKDHVVTNPNTAKRTATLIVAANDSVDKERADYVCDGVADNGEIQQAIDDLPITGGRVLLLDGTFNTTGLILIDKVRVTLMGQGASTIISTTTNNAIIEANGVDFPTISDMLLFHSGAGNVIEMNAANWFLIFNVRAVAGANVGVLMDGSGHGKIIGNTFAGDGMGIIATGGSDKNIIVGNHISYAFASIFVHSSSHNTISNNQVTGEIKINDWPSQKNLIIGNMMDNAIVDNGNGTEKAHNVEY